MTNWTDAPPPRQVALGLRGVLNGSKLHQGDLKVYDAVIEPEVIPAFKALATGRETRSDKDEIRAWLTTIYLRHSDSDQMALLLQMLRELPPVRA